MVSGFGETRRQRSILGYTDSVDIGQPNSNEGEAMSVDDDEQQPSTSAACTFESAKNVAYPSQDGIIFCDFENVSGSKNYFF